MKLKVKVGELLDAINKAILTIDKKAKVGVNLVYLNANVTAQALYIFSTTMKSESTQKLACEVEVAGEVMVDPDILTSGLARRNPELVAEIELVEHKKEGKRLRVKAGKTGAFHCLTGGIGLDTMNERMMSVPFKGAPMCQVDGNNLNEFVRRAMFCIPKSDNGQTKLEFGGLKLFNSDLGSIGWATNGKAAAKIIIKGQSKSSLAGVIIPQESLPPLNALAKKEGEIDIIEGGKNGKGDVGKLYFHMGDVYFGTFLLAGKYPDLDKTFKEHAPDFWFTVNRKDLADVLERSPKFDEKDRALEIEFVGETLILRSGAKGNGNEIEDIIAIGRDDVPEDKKVLPKDLVLTIFMNMDQLANIAGCEKTERMLLGVSKHHAKALVVYENGEEIESTYALMPMRH